MAPTQQTEPNPEKSNSQLHPASSHTNLNGDRRNITSTVRQPRQQSHSRRVGQPQGSVGVNGPTSAQQLPQSGNIHNFNRPSTSSSHPTPLFERLVTEEVQELKAYARIIENQNRRLADLERIHADLESRLQVESRGKMQLETTLEQREREWAARFHQLQSDRDRWKCEVDKEKEKNAKLYDQVVRKDQDIQRMLQRKYDNQRESTQGQSIRGNRLLNSTSERQGTPSRETTPEGTRTQQFNKSPHEILEASGSMDTVRIRNVQNLLSDFFL